MSDTYDDIIHLPHHVSTSRPQMPRANRAAQFSPFAALSGHDAAVKETARLTHERITLGESAIAMLDMKLAMLGDLVASHPEVTVTYFQEDAQKTGGAYITTTGELKKIDGHERVLVLQDGTSIGIEDVFDIECALLDAPAQ